MRAVREEVERCFEQGAAGVKVEHERGAWRVEPAPDATPYFYLEAGQGFAVWLPKPDLWEPMPESVYRRKLEAIEWLFENLLRLLQLKPLTLRELAHHVEEAVHALNRVYSGKPVVAVKYTPAHFTVIIYIAPAESPAEAVPILV